MIYKRLKYDTNLYNFKNLLQELYNTKNLEDLHLLLPNQYSVPDGINGLGKDTDSFFHKIFYEKLKHPWQEFNYLYKKIIKDVIIPSIEEETEIYQASPSYRIQYPNSKAITTIHYDSDENHKHPAGEMNILLPITKMFDSNTIWAESLPGLKDFSPMETDYGEIIIWDGNRCAHYNKSNDTKNTRISMDFRVIPNKFYNENYELNSATTGKKFIIGDYYSKI